MAGDEHAGESYFLQCGRRWEDSNNPSIEPKILSPSGFRGHEASSGDVQQPPMVVNDLSTFH
ncbi:hypothetical protein KY290_020724 [Solanum tuberosum]|uniref:Uncharacterized protein n=1 Tax=Solanum tuberosum TaxID=4113 RepID=A0ABQ7UZM7_SOLTU|nr:hypothetical protein KY290_020724 [Solanum tuberosum]